MASSQSVDRLFGIKDGENPRVIDSQHDGDGAYFETEPTAGEFFREHLPTADSVRQYIHSLFPFLGWIAHYNLTWLFGDFIAGM
jgi:sodium-independent sulfate anion transporter 11